MSERAEGRRDLRPTAAEQAFVWFQRIIAAYCLLFGILYWIRLIGYNDGSLWRFDLMPVPWQVASVTLAVMYPFAAIGLWMLASWGPVIWFICAVSETIMFIVFPAQFGYRISIVASHALVIALYCTFRIVIRMQRRNREAVENN